MKKIRLKGRTGFGGVFQHVLRGLAAIADYYELRS
jgi:hypothetical protein